LGNEIPSQFSLSQNYPNPFNPSTKIRFQIPLLRGVSEVDGLPAAGRGVLLKIHNSLGEEVSELVNQDLPPGTYEYEWNASNFSSGIYFYRLISDNFTETKKMILMK
jgi:hypothetical protein